MSRSIRQNTVQQYNPSRSDIQRETQALLAERRLLEGGSLPHTQQRRVSRQNHQQSVSYTPVAIMKKNDKVKMQQAFDRIQQILKLCKQDVGLMSGQQLKEIAKVQKAVYHLIQKTGNTQSQSQINTEKKTAQSPSKSKNLHTFSKLQPEAHHQTQLNEDTLEMIAEIQRKALTEIISLQKERDAIKQQRDQLILQLNSKGYSVSQGSGQANVLLQQNRLLKQENEALMTRIQALGHMGSYINQNNRKTDLRSTENGFSQPLHTGQYASQINIYENQLKRASQIILQLRNRLANVPGIEDLHSQGQKIRRETSELLRYKGGKSSNGAGAGNEQWKDDLIQELQEKLKTEENNKNEFLQEVKEFKQKFIQLQKENSLLKKSRVSADVNLKSYGNVNENSYNRNTYNNNPNKGSSFGDYEQTLKQMRKVNY